MLPARKDIEMVSDNLVEAHCYSKGMAGQFFLSEHVAVNRLKVRRFDRKVLCQLQTDEDLRGRNVLPSTCCYVFAQEELPSHGIGCTDMASAVISANPMCLSHRQLQQLPGGEVCI